MSSILANDPSLWLHLKQRQRAIAELLADGKQFNAAAKDPGQRLIDKLALWFSQAGQSFWQQISGKLDQAHNPNNSDTKQLTVEQITSPLFTDGHQLSKGAITKLIMAATTQQVDVKDLIDNLAAALNIAPVIEDHFDRLGSSINPIITKLFAGNSLTFDEIKIHLHPAAQALEIDSLKKSLIHYAFIQAMSSNFQNVTRAFQNLLNGLSVI